ncbi:MAG: YetF domain-containing protein, partial [Bacteroidota bacterium]
KWFYNPDESLLQATLASICIFIIVIALTRIIGLRAFAKFTTFDFAFTVAVGSVISSTLTSSTSIVYGTVIIFNLLLLTAVVAWLQRRSSQIEQLVTNEPLLLMDGHYILEDNLTAARVSRAQLMAKLREANVVRLDQVLAVVLETTGDISVLHQGSDKTVTLEDCLLDGVRERP